MTRLLTAAVLLPALWAVIKVAPMWVFVGVTLVAISVASFELYAMLERSGSGKRAGVNIPLLRSAAEWEGLGVGGAHQRQECRQLDSPRNCCFQVTLPKAVPNK